MLVKKGLGPIVCALIAVVVMGAVICAYQEHAAKRQQQFDALANQLRVVTQQAVAARTTQLPATEAAAEAEKLIGDKRIGGPQKSERVVNLPEDGGNWYTVLVTSPNWRTNADEARLVAAFDPNSNTRLGSLRRQTHFAHYTTDNPLYQARFAASVANRLPALIVERPDGQVVYDGFGQGIVGNSELADDIAAAIAGHCPDCKPKPKPNPPQVPGPGPVPNQLPDLGQPKHEPEEFPWLLLVAAGLIGGALGIGRNFRKTIAG